MELPIKSKWIFFSVVILVIFFDPNSVAQKKGNNLSQNNKTHINKEGKIFFTDEENDSLTQWKRSREFAYMGFLDSLLRKKKDLKVDTVSIDPITGKMERQRKKTSDYSAANNFLNSFPVKIFFWMLAVIFIAFIFYKIFLKNGIFTKRKNKIVEKENEDILTGLDEFSKYDSLINDAEAQNDFNLATRYLFLKSLKTLADKELINFFPEKTNHEYMDEMASNAFGKQFAALVNNYEYVWYGKFLIDKNKYQQLKEAFSTFNKKV